MIDIDKVIEQEHEEYLRYVKKCKKEGVAPLSKAEWRAERNRKANEAIASFFSDIRKVQEERSEKITEGD